jgi:hypothetical protein
MKAAGFLLPKSLIESTTSEVLDPPIERERSLRLAAASRTSWPAIDWSRCRNSSPARSIAFAN